MTLIEIMIVLAIIAVVMGFLIGPRVMQMWRESKVKTATLRAQQFVEAHTAWSLHNDDACPSSPDDLLTYKNSRQTDDPWGSQYTLVCGEDAPAGVPFGVVSKGEDPVAVLAHAPPSRASQAAPTCSATPRSPVLSCEPQDKGRH